MSDRASRVLAGAGWLSASHIGVKALDFTVIAVASAQLPLDAVGLYFLAGSLASVALELANLGLKPVLTRRAARGEVDGAVASKALLLRASLVAPLFAAGAAALFYLAPDDAPALATFAAAASIAWFHAIPRAVLMGGERFAANATIGFVARGLASGGAVAALLMGGGVVSWALARLAGEVVQLAAAWVVARPHLRAGRSAGSRSLISEGIPFWARGAGDALGGHAEIFLLAGLLGGEAVALFGIASRVFGAGRTLIRNLSAAAFPEMARRQESIDPRQLGGVAALAAALGLGLAFVAPHVLPLLVDKWSATGDGILHVFGVAIAIYVFVFPAGVWLEAHGQERAILVAKLATTPIWLLALHPLAVAQGAVGVAWVTVLRLSLQLVAFGWVTRRVHRRLSDERGVD